MRCGLTNFITERSSDEHDQIVSPPAGPDPDPLLLRGAALDLAGAVGGARQDREPAWFRRLDLRRPLAPGERLALADQAGGPPVGSAVARDLDLPHARLAGPREALHPEPPARHRRAF